MAKRPIVSSYYADDKDILDIILSARRRLTAARLARWIREERHIILSASEVRDALAETISELPYDWYSLRGLISLTETADRNEPHASTSIQFAIPPNTVIDRCAALRMERMDREEIIQVTHTGGKIKLDVTYTEIDSSRTRLFQRRERNLEIEIEVGTSCIQVRHTANERAREIVEKLFDMLRKVTNTESPPVDVTLSGIRDPSLRTKFFIEITKALEGFKDPDVTSLKVHRLTDNKPENQESESDEYNEETDSYPDESKALFAIVRKASLDGEKILHSGQYHHLKNDGFFISQMAWTAEEVRTERLVSFEAGFQKPEECESFYYDIKGIFPRTSHGSFRKSSVKRADVADDTKDLLGKLERAAASAVKLVEQEAAPPSLPSEPLPSTGS